MLPTILAVEDHADQHRRLARHRLADFVQMPHEILGRFLAPAALIVKPDHVAQGVVAEDDAQLVLALTHPIRPIRGGWDCGA